MAGQTLHRVRDQRGSRSVLRRRPQHARSRSRQPFLRAALLAIQKSYELLARYGFFAREICDKCGIVLGAVRFTRHGESEVYCSPECRGDAHGSVTRRPGRPRKYKTDREPRAAKTRQQQVYRSQPKRGKNCPYSIRNKERQRRRRTLAEEGRWQDDGFKKVVSSWKQTVDFTASFILTRLVRTGRP